MSARRPGSFNPDMASNLESGDGVLGCLVFPLSMLLFKSILPKFGGLFGLFECLRGIFGETAGVAKEGSDSTCPW